MGEPWETMESEMDRFEAEISSLGKSTPPTAVTPAPTPSFIPASLRKPPIPPPPRPKLTPVVISGGPQLYARPSRVAGPTSSLMRPTQISQRLIRPGLLPGSPPITPATGHGVIRPPPPELTMRFANPIPAPPPLLAEPSVSGIGNISTMPPSGPIPMEAEKPSTSGGQDASASSSGPSKKKKKKKQEEGEKKPKKHLRSAGGTVWEDQTLLDWDPKDFRLFCGDLGNDVTDEVLTRVFGRYPSFVKARVVRDKRSNKTKGYGFVSFKDPADFVRAIRELDGRYVGSRPIKLRKSTWENRGLVQVRKRDKLQKQLLGIGPKQPAK